MVALPPLGGGLRAWHNRFVAIVQGPSPRNTRSDSLLSSASPHLSIKTRGVSSTSKQKAVVAPVSPVSSLTGFWKNHPNLYSFLCVSYRTFSFPASVDPPQFPLSSVGDNFVDADVYGISRSGLYYFDDSGESEILYMAFDTKEALQVSFLPTQNHYFELVEG